MVRKKCPYCKRISYSAAAEGLWICPYCKKNISKIKARLINTHLQVIK